ncbi:hypothetical protein SELMODRAFT_103237 [Selaginella moellendorffii]|uniref:Germin-like protein n=1 Tax=Selaginella moellendorffii TaxID=88036 RepID=D8RW68_SELML|nr:hypothetical protein SELMODRAFT_103237 [Selaginella moellendorffii]
MAALFCFAASFLMTSLSPLQVSCSDRDPLHDFCVADLHCPLLNNNDYSCKPYPNVTIDDFVFSGLLTPLDPSQSTSGAIATPGDVNTFPGLHTQGFSFAQLDFVERGLISPHTHPRASEFVYILHGDLYAGFVDAGNRVFARVYHAGEVMIFPRGLIHWQLNVGRGRASALAVLNSEKPGFQIISLSMFGSSIADEVLEKTFRLEAETVDRLVKFFTPIAEVVKGN